MKRLNPAVRLCALLSIGFLFLPLAAVALFSVNATRHGLNWGGFTLDWYARLFQNEVVLEAAWNTLALALASTAAATVLGTLFAIGFKRYPWPRRFETFLDLLLHLPVVTPDIILAAALVVAFGILRAAAGIFEPGLAAMITGHITFQTSFVALVVAGRQAAVGREIEEAARDLYADQGTLLRRITLPLLMPGIAAGALLAFTLSLDDFVISFFTAGPDSVTLPIYIFGAVRRGVSPQIHALSTLMVLATVLAILALERLTRKKYGNGG